MKKIDENYFKIDESMKKIRIEDTLTNDEKILWRANPLKKAYIYSRIFGMLPIALIWGLFDGTIIYFMATNIASGVIPPFLIAFLVIFFILHLTPVWIWIASIAKGAIEHKNIEYAFTEKRIIVKSGMIGIDFKNIYYSDIQSVNLKVRLTDKMFKVGDIYIKSNNEAVVLYDIKNPYEITSKLQKITLDIKSDIYYPNALRPEENPGYKTKYKGENK